MYALVAWVARMDGMDTELRLCAVTRVARELKVFQTAGRTIDVVDLIPLVPAGLATPAVSLNNRLFAVSLRCDVPPPDSRLGLSHSIRATL